MNSRKKAQKAQKGEEMYELCARRSCKLPAEDGRWNMEDIWKLCDLVRETAFAVHVYFRHGYPEKVYENALANRLSRSGIEVEQQGPLRVYDEDGTEVGYYFADLIVARALIVELKAAKALTSEHEAQVLGYLRSARLEHGMLLNFGAMRFQARKFALSNARAISDVYRE